MSTNTKIRLLYADGCNCKASMQVILAGAITQDHIETIRKKLDEGVFAITHQVGLPTPAEDFAQRYEFPTEHDHAWTRMADFTDGVPSPEEMLTDVAPTHPLTIEQLLANFRRVEWNEAAEMHRYERLGKSDRNRDASPSLEM